MNKSDIVKTVIEKVHLRKPKRERQKPLFPELDVVFLSKKRAMEIVDTLFEIIKETMEKGEKLRISGFGNFQVKFKWARKGRNPQTGEQIILRSRRIVSFQPSPRLRDRLNPRGPHKSA